MKKTAIAIMVIAILSASAVTPTLGATDQLPKVVGKCALTVITSVEPRLERTPGSGSAVQFSNGGYQVSYDQISAIDSSRPGDMAAMCLVSVPRHCPPGDNRGKVYRTTNLRTKKSWEQPDSEHQCGGA